jgi:hypothetical protein
VKPQDNEQFQFWQVLVPCFVVSGLVTYLVMLSLRWLLGPPSSDFEPVVTSFIILCVTYYFALILRLKWMARQNARS